MTNKIITPEDISKIKNMILSRNTHKIMEILNNLEEIKEKEETKQDGSTKENKN